MVCFQRSATLQHSSLTSATSLDAEHGMKFYVHTQLFPARIILGLATDMTRHCLLEVYFRADDMQGTNFSHLQSSSDEQDTAQFGVFIPTMQLPWKPAKVLLGKKNQGSFVCDCGKQLPFLALTDVIDRFSLLWLKEGSASAPRWQQKRMHAAKGRVGNRNRQEVYFFLKANSYWD